jgi:hypothetical protein
VRPFPGPEGRSLVPVLFVLLLFARSARAIDPFEIQVYDGTANAPGAVGLELHLNRVFAGLHSAAAPELAPNHQTHFTLEPSLGIFAWWELGGYLQSTLRADGGFAYSGVKLRSKFVVPEGTYRELRLGLNLELSALPERYDAGRWAVEVRPIIAWESSRWLLAANPILGVGLTDLRSGPDLEPAAMAKIKLAEAYALGLEYYASLGPIARLGRANQLSHYLYETFDLLSVPHFELNFGVGEGLSKASNDLTLKLILGYTWED